MPIPDLVTRSGRGDVYGSSVWLGQAPTDTPLHRDPNPNLLVQLAGTKVVRLLPPPVGLALFERVREEIVRRGAARASMAAAAMRGDEMMQGPEKSAFEREVWGGVGAEVEGLWEVELGAGDGLFIPLGWWHSVKGVGEGMTGSVCDDHDSFFLTLTRFPRLVSPLTFDGCVIVLQVNWWFR